MQIPEITIRGHLTFTPGDAASRAFLEAAAAADGGPVTRAEDVARELEAARVGGAPAVFLRIECGGGAAAAVRPVCDALRAFHAGGGRVFAFVAKAMSGAVEIAALADVVIVHPAGRFGIHATIPPGDLSPEDAERTRAARLAAALELLDARTATPRSTLAEWLDTREDDDHLHVVELDAREAVAHGWADVIAAEAEARGMAGLFAQGFTAASVRHEVLRGRVRDMPGLPPPRLASYPRRGSTAPGFGLCVANVPDKSIGNPLLDDGAVDARVLQADVFRTTNYTPGGDVGTDTEYAISGAKMRRNEGLAQGAPALLVDPNGFKIGQFTFPGRFRTYSFTISNADRTATVAISTEPDTNYVIIANPRAVSGAAAVNSLIVNSILKNTTSFQLTSVAAPGSGCSVTWDVAFLRLS